jgi:predicted nucleic acid-binding Zn ribbon protein
MDCPNCGVYNPEERTICWRCDQELPKPEEPKKKRKDPAATMRRAWILIFVVLVIWIVMTWLLPMILGNGTPTFP